MNILNEIEGSKYYCQYCHDDDINQHYLFVYEKETDKVIETHEGGDASSICDLLLWHGKTESKVDEIVQDYKCFMKLPSPDEIEEMYEEHKKEQLQERDSNIESKLE